MNVPALSSLALAADVEGAGAYRKLADHLRGAVIGLGTRPDRPPHPERIATAPPEPVVAATEPVRKARGGDHRAGKQAKA